jgi:hypothetical protein
MRSCVCFSDHIYQLLHSIVNLFSVLICSQKSSTSEHIAKPVENICRIFWVKFVKTCIVFGFLELPAHYYCPTEDKFPLIFGEGVHLPSKQISNTLRWPEKMKCTQHYLRSNLVCLTFD